MLYLNKAHELCIWINRIYNTGLAFVMPCFNISLSYVQKILHETLEDPTKPTVFITD